MKYLVAIEAAGVVTNLVLAFVFRDPLFLLLAAGFWILLFLAIVIERMQEAT